MRSKTPSVATSIQEFSPGQMCNSKAGGIKPSSRRHEVDKDINDLTPLCKKASKFKQCCKPTMPTDRIKLLFLMSFLMKRADSREAQATSNRQHMLTLAASSVRT